MACSKCGAPTGRRVCRDCELAERYSSDSHYDDVDARDSRDRRAIAADGDARQTSITEWGE